jgi:glutathione reductase (NADPH)
MTSENIELFVLGAGSGGVRAARMAAATGARVVVAEERDLGGTCVNVGCVPKKLMVYASHLREEVEDADGLGWQVEPPIFEWDRFRDRKDAEIRRLNGIYRRLLDDSGAEIIEDRAHLLGPHEVAAGGRVFRANNIVIATGGRPRRSSVPGGELALISDEIFHLPALPRRVLVVGGGYIAVEFAGIFHGFGCEVALVHRGHHLLRGFDQEIADLLARSMRDRGIELHLASQLRAIRRDGDGLVVSLDNGREHSCDAVALAIGRDPNTSDLGLEQAGVELDSAGAVVVDPYSRTSVPHIWAIGDCTNRLNLTPVAIAEAMALVATIFEGKPTAADHHDVPTAVFSQPPLATVGMTEEQAAERGGYQVYRSKFRPLKHTLSGRDEQTLVKLIVETSTQRVSGAHMLGPDAAEILQGLAIAIKAGATKADFDATIGIHPTTAEEFVTLRAAGPAGH